MYRGEECTVFVGLAFSPWTPAPSTPVKPGTPGAPASPCQSEWYVMVNCDAFQFYTTWAASSATANYTLSPLCPCPGGPRLPLGPSNPLSPCNTQKNCELHQTLELFVKVLVDATNSRELAFGPTGPSPGKPRGPCIPIGPVGPWTLEPVQNQTRHYFPVEVYYYTQSVIGHQASLTWMFHQSSKSPRNSNLSRKNWRVCTDMCSVKKRQKC